MYASGVMTIKSTWFKTWEK